MTSGGIQGQAEVVRVEARGKERVCEPLCLGGAVTGSRVVTRWTVQQSQVRGSSRSQGATWPSVGWRGAERAPTTGAAGRRVCREGCHLEREPWSSAPPG